MSSSTPEALTAAVLTVSDSSARGERSDLSGPAVAEALRKAGFEVVATEIIPDDQVVGIPIIDYVDTHCSVELIVQNLDAVGVAGARADCVVRTIDKPDATSRLLLELRVLNLRNLGLIKDHTMRKLLDVDIVERQE